VRADWRSSRTEHQREPAEGSLTRKIATSRAPFRDRSDKTHADNGQRGIARSIVSSEGKEKGLAHKTAQFCRTFPPLFAYRSFFGEEGAAAISWPSFHSHRLVGVPIGSCARSIARHKFIRSGKTNGDRRVPIFHAAER